MRPKLSDPGSLVLIAAAQSSLLLIGLRLGTNTQSTGACCGTNPPTTPRELDFPYYSLRDGFASTLNLVSDSPKPLDFILALHSLAGEALLSSIMTIQPSAKLPIDLAGPISSLGAEPICPFGEGSISIYFSGTIIPLVGQVSMTNPSLHLSQEAEMVENDPGRTDIPSVLSGAWWGLAGGLRRKPLARGQPVLSGSYQSGGRPSPSATPAASPAPTRTEQPPTPTTAAPRIMRATFTSGHTRCLTN